MNIMEKLNYLMENIGILFYPLTFFAFFGAILIIERLIYLIRLSKPSKCLSYSKIQQELISNKNKPKEIRDELISFRLMGLNDQLNYGIRSLRIISVLSPMLGLLGTVLGMIDSFGAIADHQGPIQPSVIAGGLQNAMSTTAYGLIIALPCLFFAFIYARIAENRVSVLQNNLNAISLELEGVHLNND